MSDPLIHSEEHFVVIVPGKKEEILNKKKTLDWLIEWISKLEKLPKDLENQPNINSIAKRLMDTACDLEIMPGFTIRWFAVRIEPPN